LAFGSNANLTNNGNPVAFKNSDNLFSTPQTMPRIYIADGNFYMTQGNGGVDQTINYDDQDYQVFRREINQLDWRLGGANIFSINPTTITATRPLIFPAANPTANTNAAHKGYVDAQVGTRLALAGGIVTGELGTGYGKLRTVAGIQRIDHTEDGWSETFDFSNGFRTWRNPTGTQMSLDAASILNISGAYSTSGSTGIAVNGYDTFSGNFLTTLTRSNPNWEQISTQAIHLPGSWAGYRILVGSATPQEYSFRNGGSAFAPGNWFGGSDGRVKTERQTIADPLEKIIQLNGFSYLRTDLGSRDVGLIAQDVKAVLPEAVVVGSEPFQDGEGFHHLNYNAVTALMVEGIKALTGQLKAQQAEIDALKARLADSE
jgi:hypothetical protein